MKPPPKPRPVQTAWELFVVPFYLDLLHGNFAFPRKADEGSIRQAVAAAARTISDEQIKLLLDEPGWRDRLCAAWFVGLSRRDRFVPSIGKLLLASELVYAGQGYCAALGLIGNEECARLLRSYLDLYLPLDGRIYNQDWAIGALTYIEGDSSAGYLKQDLWRDGKYVIDPAKGIERFDKLVAFLRQHGMIEGVS
jgi:hypothetical protein